MSTEIFFSIQLIIFLCVFMQFPKCVVSMNPWICVFANCPYLTNLAYHKHTSWLLARHTAVNDGLIRKSN